MAEAKQQSDWDQTSWILAMMFNANRSKKTSAKTPSYFHPYREAPGDSWDELQDRLGCED